MPKIPSGLLSVALIIGLVGIRGREPCGRSSGSETEPTLFPAFFCTNGFSATKGDGYMQMT